MSSDTDLAKLLLDFGKEVAALLAGGFLTVRYWLKCRRTSDGEAHELEMTRLNMWKNVVDRHETRMDQHDAKLETHGAKLEASGLQVTALTVEMDHVKEIMPKTNSLLTRIAAFYDARSRPRTLEEKPLGQGHTLVKPKKES